MIAVIVVVSSAYSVPSVPAAKPAAAYPLLLRPALLLILLLLQHHGAVKEKVNLTCSFTVNSKFSTPKVNVIRI